MAMFSPRGKELEARLTTARRRTKAAWKTWKKSPSEIRGVNSNKVRKITGARALFPLASETTWSEYHTSQLLHAKLLFDDGPQ